MSTEPAGPGGDGGAVSAPAVQPSAPAPEAQPSAAPGGAQPTGGGASAAPADASAASGTDEVRRSTIKPIPDRPRNDDGSFKKGDLHRKDLGFKPRSERDGSPERQFPGKRPTVPDAPIAAKPGEQAPVPPADPNAPQVAAKPAPFKFAGQDFESQAQAEANFSTLRGQYNKVNNDFRVESQKANGWYQHALGLQAKLDAQGGGAPASALAGAKPADPSAANPAPSDPNDPLSGIDLGIYEQLADVSGPKVAAAWLAKESAKNERARTESLIEAAIAPFKEAAERQAETSRVVSQVQTLQSWADSQKGPDGAALYPELADQSASREIGEMCGQFVAMGMPEQHALGPLGLRMAVLLRRDAMGPVPATPAPATSTPQNPAAAAVAASLLRQPPSADPVSGLSSPTNRNPGAPMTREQQVLSDMRTARLPDPDLGFVRRSHPI